MVRSRYNLLEPLQRVPDNTQQRHCICLDGDI